jgi:hypothetical protein
VSDLKDDKEVNEKLEEIKAEAAPHVDAHAPEVVYVKEIKDDGLMEVVGEEVRSITNGIISLIYN